MFLAYRIQACSMLIQEHVYMTGIVGAAMKNKVSYNFKMKIDKLTGDPVNTHCECPAGKGPHGTCKHLAAVLLMLQHFINTGEIQVEKSCTESLQTFHKPKFTHKGAPVAAEELPSKRKTGDDFLEDPRPQKYRNTEGYNDFVRNCIINHCSATSQDVAMRYLYRRANIQVAALDHDYTPLPFTEYWVDSAVQVTETQVSIIEETTRSQSSSKIWYKERAWRLTASRFGEVCKMTHRRNIQKLCSSLLNTNKTYSEGMSHGKNYEAKAMAAFEKKMQIKTKKAGFFIYVQKPFLGATPDAIIDHNYIVEVKCPYNGRNEKIKPGKNFGFLMYNEQGKIVLKNNSNYFYQVQGQLFITKRQFCFFVVYTFCDLFVQKIELEHDYCYNSMIPKLELFYSKYFRPFIASTL
ncbi:uncharacterized protein LOC110456373 [Mizuhopecten yessoensis]|uniref:uncharacterized protein LOC110456373 n=1 Tax=Mizuhopecten yessoensis TaxID=6573 RepID=UPI000B457EFD|nr:uncharacterized protein LOC110456373 [Mizuhopecten yessoensis]